MKKVLLLIIISVITVSSCKKDLEDRYYNPDQLRGGTSDIVPGLFTQLLTTNKIFVQDYGEWFYLLSGGTSITGYEQVCNRYISYRYDWFSTYNDLNTGNVLTIILLPASPILKAAIHDSKTGKRLKARWINAADRIRRMQNCTSNWQH